MNSFKNSPFFDIKIGSLKKEKNKKVISFSLYGSDDKYSKGILKNIDLAKKHYPGWICRFYCDEEPSNLIQISKEDCEFLIIDSKIPPMYWRFFTAGDSDVFATISRDTDSLVNPRESAAVNEWLSSKKSFHTMHDCDAGHWSAVMGGMWGVINKDLKINIIEEIDSFCKSHNYNFRYSQDQTFLTKKILPLFLDSVIDHNKSPEKSKIPNSKKFPPHEKLEYGRFVGQRISIFEFEKSSLNSLNIDSNKIFLMPHGSLGDMKKTKKVIDLCLEKYEEVVLPYRNSCSEYIKNNFHSKNLITEKVSSNTESFNIFNSKYKKTHKFIGLGNHGHKIEGYSGYTQAKIMTQAGFSKNSQAVNIKEEKNSKTFREVKVKHFNNEKEPKVSVVIGTFNRWEFLKKAVESVKNQTYKNLEIKIINDGSTDTDYKNEIPPGVIWINLPENSNEAHGFRCRSYTYNYGLKISKGKYIAFLDDDDAWYPTKIEKQVKVMQKHGSGMCSTEAVQGRGVFDPQKEYQLYLGGIDKRIKKYAGDFPNGVPNFWNEKTLSIHNFLIGSSVMVKKSIMEEVGLLNETRRYKKGQDYEFWKRILSITDCVNIKEPLTYYDRGHGNGRQY